MGYSCDWKDLSKENKDKVMAAQKKGHGHPRGKKSHIKNMHNIKCKISECPAQSQVAEELASIKRAIAKMHTIS